MTLAPISPSDPSWSQALNLAERVALLRTSPRNALSDDKIALAMRRLKRWQEQPAFHTRDNEGLFQQRLATEGISENELMLLLAEPVAAEHVLAPNPPAWLRTLIDALSHGSAKSTLHHRKLQDMVAQELLEPALPFVSVAAERLRAGAERLTTQYPHAPFDPRVVSELFAGPALFGRLLNMLLRTMILELNAARIQGQLLGDTPQERFASFVRSMRSPERLLALFREYPVLGRQISTCVEQWESFSVELLTHLCADWEQVRRLFTGAGEPGRLTEACFGQGDQHQSGRTVVILKFESGQQVVYKPRSLAVDVHFQQFLGWINERTPLAFRNILVLDRGDHGWSEFVPQSECRSKQEIGRFYTRLGALLSILHALQATDIHFENLIAARDQPVLVDLESLLQPGMAMPTGEPAPLAAESVLRIGLLPTRLWAALDHAGLDLSALSAVEGQTTPYTVVRYENAGTDEMRVVRRRVNVPGGRHRPMLHGSEVDVGEFKHEFMEGFTSVYELLASSGNELLSPTGVLSNFASDQIRVVLRATRTYSALLSESFHPNALRDALDRDRLFDHLWSGIQGQHSVAKVIAREKESLWNNDVPMFVTTVSSTDLRSSNAEPIPDFLAESGMSRAQRRIRTLGKEDLRRQQHLIRISLAATSSNPIQRLINTPDRDAVVSLSAEDLQNKMLEEATRIGQRLSELAFRREEEAGWIGLSAPGERDWSCQELGLNLYDGLPGVVLFLAQLAAINHELRYQKLAREGFATLRRTIRLGLGRMKTIGAFDGWGGVIYAVSRMALLWEEPGLLDEADQIVEHLRSLVEQDTHLDVVSGSAGCLGGLFALHQARSLMDMNSDRALSTAIKCGEHLLAHAEKLDAGVAWKTHIHSRQPLTGFSHGAAGIAWALLRLGSLTSEERFRAAAIDGIGYEQSLFSAVDENWPDLRSLSPDAPLEPAFSVTWCHGAPGIGLARASTLGLLDTPSMRRDIEAAVRTTSLHGFGMNHSLCHGDFGNLELLLAAGHALNREDLTTEANRRASALLRSIEKQGYLCGTPHGVESPGLMTGIAGIGYELLHFAESRRVPSVLTLAPLQPDFQPRMAAIRNDNRPSRAFS
jgi:type 2 lantibiotic biosynthesis protein LanM